MKRDLPLALLLLFLLGLLGALAWASRNPEAAWLDRVGQWPGIGSGVERFRDLYRAPPPAPARRPEREAPTGLDGASDDGLPPADARPLVWVIPGTPIRSAPDPAAPVVWTADAITNLRFFERRGDWYRIWRRDLEGWVFLPGYEDGDEPPFGSEPDPPLPLPARDPDPEELATARELLGANERSGRLGPYDLYTDVEDGALRDALDRLAAATEPTYRGRYGLAPIGEPRAALVLYRGEGGYRLLQARSRRLFGLTPSGHTAYGLAVLFVGDRRPEEVGSTLVHELVHLLNRRALGPALPPWLDEGLADDLAFGVGAEGGLDPTRLAGSEERVDDGSRVVYSGAWGSLWSVRRALDDGRLPRLADLLAMSWEEFVVGADPELHYDAAALFVHFLLEGSAGAHAEGFRAWMAGVARGEPPTAERLSDAVGAPLPMLEAAYLSWLRLRSDELRERTVQEVTIFR